MVTKCRRLQSELSASVSMQIGYPPMWFWDEFWELWIFHVPQIEQPRPLCGAMTLRQHIVLPAMKSHGTSFLRVFTTTVYRCEDNGRCAANLQEMNPPSPPLIMLIAPSWISQCEVDGRAAQRFPRDYVSVPRSVLFGSLILPHPYLATVLAVFTISSFEYVLGEDLKLRPLISLECVAWYFCVVAVILKSISVTACMCMYEGWNFNSGNYLFTNDTK